MRSHVSRREIDAFFGDCPETPVTCFMVVGEQRLFTSFDGNLPDAGDGSPLGVVKNFAVRGFEAFESSLPGHLMSLAALGRNLPDLHTTAACGAEINPLSIT